MNEVEFIAKLGSLSTANLEKADREFCRVVLQHYKLFGREFPWRKTRDPYEILVSEVMLQQTQTDRVVKKYAEFLERFPTWHALASAKQVDVLKLWAGLGYYRRARNLHMAAQAVVSEREEPTTYAHLKGLPGVGPYTAAAVSAFAFGEAVPMIETNIRTVYLHAYFRGLEMVSDKEILPVVERTLHKKDPRVWFYALMDLGVVLKRHIKGVNKRSLHYSRQSPFKGSTRQTRAAVLKILTLGSSSMTLPTIERTLEEQGLTNDGDRVQLVISRLCDEGFVVRERGRYRVA